MNCERIFEEFSKCSHWVLSISGGGDSMTLMHKVHEWTSHRARSPHIIVATVDHNTGIMAKTACKIVRHWANAFGFDFTSTVWVEKQHSNFYGRARLFRYKFLCKTCAENGKNGAIFTAHHLQDSVETALINIERGSGIDGLCSIKEVTLFKDHALVRPMLSMTKKHIRKYLSELNFPWIEDKANDNTHFRRAYYRHNVIAKLNPLFQNRVRLLSSNARCARDALDHYTQLEHDKCTTKTSGTISLISEVFCQLPTEIQRRIIIKIASEKLGSKANPRLKNLDRCISLIHENKTAIICGVLFKPKGKYIIIKEEGASLTIDAS